MILCQKFWCHQDPQEFLGKQKRPNRIVMIFNVDAARNQSFNAFGYCWQPPAVRVLQQFEQSTCGTLTLSAHNVVRKHAKHT